MWVQEGHGLYNSKSLNQSVYFIWVKQTKSEISVDNNKNPRSIRKYVYVEQLNQWTSRSPNLFRTSTHEFETRSLLISHLDEMRLPLLCGKRYKPRRCGRWAVRYSNREPTERGRERGERMMKVPLASHCRPDCPRWWHISRLVLVCYTAVTVPVLNPPLSVLNTV
jgi:hypothetical protein